MTTVDISINHAILAEIARGLRIAVPHVRVMRGRPGQRTMGEAIIHEGKINIFANAASFQDDRLRTVNREISEVLLHEMRHIWQATYWGRAYVENDMKRPYALQRIERDANRWAEENRARYPGLVRVKRTSARRQPLPG